MGTTAGADAKATAKRGGASAIGRRRRVAFRLPGALPGSRATPDLPAWRHGRGGGHRAGDLPAPLAPSPSRTGRSRFLAARRSAAASPTTICAASGAARRAKPRRRATQRQRGGADESARDEGARLRAALTRLQPRDRIALSCLGPALCEDRPGDRGSGLVHGRGAGRATRRLRDAYARTAASLAGTGPEPQASMLSARDARPVAARLPGPDGERRGTRLVHGHLRRRLHRRPAGHRRLANLQSRRAGGGTPHCL